MKKEMNSNLAPFVTHAGFFLGEYCDADPIPLSIAMLTPLVREYG
jgi:hypothetical protein